MVNKTRQQTIQRWYEDIPHLNLEEVTEKIKIELEKQDKKLLEEVYAEWREWSIYNSGNYNKNLFDESLYEGLVKDAVGIPKDVLIEEILNFTKQLKMWKCTNRIVNSLFFMREVFVCPLGCHTVKINKLKLSERLHLESKNKIIPTVILLTVLIISLALYLL